MKKISIWGIVCLLLLGGRIIYCQEHAKRVFVFVVDLSGSMQKDGLHNIVKKDLINFLTGVNEQGKHNLNIGDRAILMGFGDNVSYFWDREIQKVEDLEDLATTVNKLVFNHKWTHMSRAFDMLATRMREINASNPEAQKVIYIYTDGKNEPPPEIGESPVTFGRILEEYWNPEQIKPLQIWLYFITFGVPAPEEVKQLAKNNPERVKIEQKTREVPISETSITPPPPSQPEKPQPQQPSVPKTKVSKKKFLLCAVIPVLATILFVLWYLSIPKFSKEYYLVEVDDRNEEIMPWQIKRAQKLFSDRVVVSRDLKINDMDTNAFAIRIGRNRNIQLMPIKSSILLEGTQIQSNTWQTIMENETFTCNNRRFRIERRK